MNTRSILYVEDDQDLQKIVKDLLTDLGYGVVLASNIGEALLKMTNQTFDLFLLDYNLGYNATSESIIDKIIKQTPKKPIILMSGVLDRDIVQRLQKKVDTILVKPVTPDRFEATINKLLC